MFRNRFLRAIAVWLVLGAILAVPTAPAFAQRTDVALFRGFGQSPGTAGMDTLNRTLQSSFTDISSQVFAWTEQEAAYNFISNNAEGRDFLVLIGFSLGGSSLIGLADDYLRPNAFLVDLTVQIDSVDLYPLSPRDDALPPNVRQGINYFQNSTDLFEPQGERNVAGATNINVEELFNDTAITHYSIDDDRRLHGRIVNDIAAARPVRPVPEPGTLTLFAAGALGLLGSGWRRRKRAA
jgi:hypothetical protein